MNTLSLKERLRNLPVAVVEQQLQNPHTVLPQVPKDLRLYLLQVNDAGQIIKNGVQSTRQMAEALQTKYPELSLRTCQSRIADALSTLYHDTENTADEWRLFYADQMMALAKMALDEGNLQEARRCMERAKEYTEEATKNHIADEQTNFLPTLISPDVTAARMGHTDPRGIRELRRQTLRILENVDLTEPERQRLEQEVEQEFGY